MRSIASLTIFLTLLITALNTSAEQVIDQQLKAAFTDHVTAIKNTNYAALSKQIHPREAIEFKETFLNLAKKAEKYDEFGKFARVFPWVNSVEHIEQTHASEILTKLMASTVGRDRGFIRALQTAEFKLLGQVYEAKGDDEKAIAHLVFRLTMFIKGNTVETMDLASFMKGDDGKYYARIDEKLRMVVDSLTAHYNARERG